MITLITGQPGAGKTFYVVEKMLMPLAAKGWLEDAIDPSGNKVKVKRRLLTNINGLLLEHEKIGIDELNTWHEWAQPGDLIVYDEVQEPWPLKAMGSAKPAYIQKLETHRHMGVDFVLPSQHPMLVDAAICRLAGKHLHVRKVANTRFATVYEWDGVSRTLLYKNALAKQAWRRGKAAEKCYRSSALHTKQKRAVPSVIFGIVLAVAGLVFGGPVVYGRIQERIHPEMLAKTETPRATPAKPGAASAAPAATAVADMGPKQQVPTIPGLGNPVASPKSVGCAATATSCKCFDSSGEPATEKPLEYCLAKTGVGLPQKVADLSSIQEQPRGPEPLTAQDREAREFMQWLARK